MIGFSKEKQIGKPKKKALGFTHDKQASERKKALRKPLKPVSKKQSKELKVRSKLKAQLVIESEGKCMTCKKKPRNGLGLSLSHIVPLSRGGETTRENCLVECFQDHTRYEKKPEERPMWQQVRAGISEAQEREKWLEEELQALEEPELLDMDR